MYLISIRGGSVIATTNRRTRVDRLIDKYVQNRAQHERGKCRPGDRVLTGPCETEGAEVAAGAVVVLLAEGTERDIVFVANQS